MSGNSLEFAEFGEIQWKRAKILNSEWIRASKTIEKALGLAMIPASGPQSPQITPKSGNFIKFSIIYLISGEFTKISGICDFL